MRLFVAVDLDTDRRAAIGRTIDGLRRALGSTGWDSAARWVSLRNLHLSVRFIGELPDAAWARVCEGLAAPLAVGPIEVVFEGAGVFPPRGAPRVLWIGVAGGVDGLTHVFEAVEARLLAAGVAPETRPLSPHLTVARFRDRGRRAGGAGFAGAEWRRLADAVASVHIGAGSMPVRSITLYQSRLTPTGPEYSALLSTPLGEKRGD